MVERLAEEIQGRKGAPPVNLLGCKPDYRKMNGKNMEKKVLPPY